MKKLITFTLLSLILVAPVIADTTNSSTSETNSSSSSTIENGAFQDNREYNNTGSEMKRYFSPAGEIQYPGTPGRFDAPPERSGYMNSINIDGITEYDDEGLTTAEAMNMAKDGSGGKRVLVRSKYGTVKKEDRLDTGIPMMIVYKKHPGMRSLGIITIVSDSKKAISPDVFAQAQVEAWKLGGRLMHVKAQGFQREVHTFGWGIGFSWTGTAISGGGQTSATTGVMGVGASWGQAGYYDHPFIIIHVLTPK